MSKLDVVDVGVGSQEAVYAEISAANGYGLHGHAFGAFGVGVQGCAFDTDGCGVYGYAPGALGCGVIGDGINYGVYSFGNFAASGFKSCIVKTSQGPTHLYCQESPENWFEDFGEGQLSGGTCHIELDPLFLETVTIDGENPMKVFIQLNDECHGTYVTRGATGFDVVELQEGRSDARFTYRVVAKRSGFEDQRLDVCEVAKRDPYLYPGLREEKERRERE